MRGWHSISLRQPQTGPHEFPLVRQILLIYKATTGAHVERIQHLSTSDMKISKLPKDERSGRLRRPVSLYGEAGQIPAFAASFESQLALLSLVRRRYRMGSR